MAAIANTKAILKIAVPSVAVTYVVLQYFDPHQSGRHSENMRKYLHGEHEISRQTILEHTTSAISGFIVMFGLA